jgi:NADH-quinone oxidoreductase subunit C
MATPEQTLQDLNTKLQPRILTTATYAGELTITVRAAELTGVMLGLRDDFGFELLVDIATVDRYTDELRFEVIYNLFNLQLNRRLRVKVLLEEAHPEVDTITHLWPSAMWHEREAWDMMGIRFTGHPDLRRMYLPEDFEYHPLRKEFPLVGIPGTIALPVKND